MTTSANIATAVVPLALIRKRQWPYHGKLPHLIPLDLLRKTKSSK